MMEKEQGGGWRGEDDDDEEFSTLSISLVLHSSTRCYTGFTKSLIMVHIPALGSHNIFVHSYTQAHAWLPHKAKLYPWLSYVPITVPAWYKSCLIHELSIESIWFIIHFMLQLALPSLTFRNQRGNRRSRTQGLLVSESCWVNLLNTTQIQTHHCNDPGSGILIFLLNKCLSSPLL